MNVVMKTDRKECDFFTHKICVNQKKTIIKGRVDSDFVDFVKSVSDIEFESKIEIFFCNIVIRKKYTEIRFLDGAKRPVISCVTRQNVNIKIDN